jgi:hypothetical protein
MKSFRLSMPRTRYEKAVAFGFFSVFVAPFVLSALLGLAYYLFPGLRTHLENWVDHF